MIKPLAAVLGAASLGLCWWSLGLLACSSECSCCSSLLFRGVNSPRTSSRWRVPADVQSGGASSPQAGSHRTLFHRCRPKQPRVVFKAGWFSPHVWWSRGGHLVDLGRARPRLSSVCFFLSSLFRDLLFSALIFRPKCESAHLLSAEF